MSRDYKAVIEITEELRMSGKMQICLLHRSDTREVKQFEIFAPKEGGPRAPGFYRPNPDRFYLKDGYRRGGDGKYWESVSLTPDVDSLEFLGKENPLAIKAAPLKAVSAPRAA